MSIARPRRRWLRWLGWENTGAYSCQTASATCQARWPRVADRANCLKGQRFVLVSTSSLTRSTSTPQGVCAEYRRAAFSPRHRTRSVLSGCCIRSVWAASARCFARTTRRGPPRRGQGAASATIPPNRCRPLRPRSRASSSTPSNTARSSVRLRPVSKAPRLLVQEFIVGDSMDVALREYGPAPLADALTRITQLAAALDLAAASGIRTERCIRATCSSRRARRS